MNDSLKRKLKRRSAIEPTIGHLKTEGRLDRCPLKGQLGDAMFALLCAAGHNLRMIVNFLKKSCIADSLATSNKQVKWAS